MSIDSNELSFLDAIHSGIIIVNEDLTVYFWNKWLETRTNISKEEIIEENLLDFYHYIDEEQLRRKIKFVTNFKSQSFYSVNPHRFLIDIKLSNITNKVFDLMQQNVSLSPFPYNGKDYIIIQIDDVTELEATNLRLKVEKNENEMILNSQSNLIFISTENSLKKVNKTVLEFFGYENFEKLQENYTEFSDFFDEDLGLKEIDSLNNNLVKLKDKNNKLYIFKIDITSAVLEDETLYIITLTDVTELEKNKQKLIISSKNAAMGEMISMIAHQWRQPLSTISANIGNINVHKQLGLLTDDIWNNKIGNVNTSLTYMSQTIDDFRDFFKNKDLLKEVTLKELVEKPFNIIESSFKSNFCNCLFSYDFDESKTIFTYPNKFDQVILNIYKNSLDEYISKQVKGVNKVLIKCENEHFIIEITDNAGGIPDDIIDKIWEPYFSTKSLNGTGIGLHMVKIIIEQQLKGTINIENICNMDGSKGISCIITLPMNLKSE